MNFKFLVIGAFLIVFVGCIGSTLHYKKQAESTALLLKQSDVATVSNAKCGIDRATQSS